MSYADTDLLIGLVIVNAECSRCFDLHVYKWPIWSVELQVDVRASSIASKIGDSRL
jgi:hypothetical protein